MIPPRPEDLVEISAAQLRAMGLDELLGLLGNLGYSIEGVDTPTKALTRLMSSVYAVEV